MLLFADDTNIFYSHSCLKTLNETLQTEVDKIAEWLNTNKLSINTSKTKFILFRSSKKKKKHVVRLSINNDDIKQVKSTTFLGVVIDECLSWNDHIDSVAKKIVKSAGIIAKIRHFTNLNTLKLIYYALVYPYLIYGNLIWSNTYKTRIQKLTNIQKKIIRLMTFQSNFSHTENIFIDLQILNLSKLNNYLTSLFMFRYHHLNNLPKFFTNCFISNNQIHQYNTRNSTKLHKSYQRTNYVKHSLSVKGVDVWNNLDSNLTIITSRPFLRKNPKYTFYVINLIKHFNCNFSSCK